MNFVKSIMLLAVMTVLFMAVGWLIGGTAGMVIALGFAAATNTFAWWNSDKLALRVHNAQATTPQSHPDLHALVARLAQRAGLPMPRIYLIGAEQPNAFATGRSPDNAAVAVTAGLLHLLNRDEVEGVIAHELAHIEHRDTLTMTVAATFAGAISMLAQFGFFFGGSRDNRSPLGGLGVLLAVIVAPMAAMLVQMTISRTREYAADRRGAEISGKPLALASALRKISLVSRRFQMRSAERYPGTAHLFIFNPLAGTRVDSLFATHPSVENRIAELEEMAASGEFGRHGGSVPDDVAGSLSGDLADSGLFNSGPFDSGPFNADPPVQPSGIPSVRRVRIRRLPWR
jgi:heat shock protein HtpX